MVIGYTPGKENANLVRTTICGGLAGGVMRVCTQPIDVMKTRLQVNSAKSNSTLLSVVRQLYHENGYKAFYKGHLSAQLLSTVSAAARFPALELTTKSLYIATNGKSANKNFSHISNLSCGMASGGIAHLAANPFDVLRTRFIVQSNNQYSSIHNAVISMYKENGIRTFYKGIQPRLIEIMLFSGLQFMFYRFFNSLAAETSLSSRVGDVMISSSAAGCMAKFCCYPMDVARKRMQIHGFKNAQLPGISKLQSYPTLYTCIAGTIKNEGIRGVYRGLVPSLVKASLGSLLQFTFYDLFCSLSKSMSEQKPLTVSHSNVNFMSVPSTH